MSPLEIERYLHDRIPLSRHMAAAVVSVDDSGVRLSAPLAPNINHRGTVFGGSASALAILAGWTLVHTGLQSLGFVSRVVIQRNAIEYRAPITGAFEAFAAAPEADAWEVCLEGLRNRGKARIGVSVVVQQEGRTVATFEGTYVAFNLASGNG